MITQSQKYKQLTRQALAKLPFGQKARILYDKERNLFNNLRCSPRLQIRKPFSAHQQTERLLLDHAVLEGDNKDANHIASP